MWNANRLVQDWIRSPYPFPTMVTITLWVSPQNKKMWLYIQSNMPSCQILEYTGYIPHSLQKSNTLITQIKGVLYIRLNWIWWWGFSSGDLGNVEYSFIAITPSSTLTQSVHAYYGLVYGSNRSVWKLLILDKNTWNCTAMCKLVLDRNAWSCNCLQRIIIRYRASQNRWDPLI